MRKFLKKQFIKLLLYGAFLIIIIGFYYFEKVDKNTLLSSIALVTSLFTPFVNKDLEEYKTKLSSYTLVTKLQYDLEFEVYTKIYEMIFLLSIETDKLLPPIDNLPPEKEAFKIEIGNRLKRFEELYDKTSNTINKYRPFYSNEIFKILRETKDLCLKESKEVSLTVILYPKPFDYLKSIDRKEKINEMLEIVSNLIKERIKNMRIIEE